MRANDTPSAAESQVEKLLNTLDDTLDIDPATADIEMPQDYGTLVWANRRVMLVRDANISKINTMANKALNPSASEQLERNFNLLCWEVALIDKRYPEAKRISRDLMQAEADRERAARLQR